jgi:DNA polymerase sigma
VDIDDRVRPLAMIIKYWAKSRLLNDAAGGGTLTSYTWILMAINFLQTRNPPILPSLHKLPHRPRMSNGIDVGFFDDISKLQDFGVKNEETLGGLLYAFFVKYDPSCCALLTLDLHLNLITAMKSSRFAQVAVSRKKQKDGI